MKVKEIFKDEEVVINYINDNMILDDNYFTISDVIRIIRNNPEKSYLITKYIAFRRENTITEKHEKCIDDLFGDEENETSLFEERITSIWENITTIKEGKHTYDRILKSYLKKLSENEDVTKDIYKNIIKVFRLNKNIYKDLIFLDIIGKINFNMFIEYNDFIKMINNNNNSLYLNVWLNDNYKNYLNKYNIKRIGELKRYLNEKNIIKNIQNYMD